MTPSRSKNVRQGATTLIRAGDPRRHQLHFLRSWCWATLFLCRSCAVPNCQLLRYPIEHDTMLAVKQALQRGYERLVLVGMLGGEATTPLPISRHWCTRWSTQRSTDYRQQLLYHRHQGGHADSDQRGFHFSVFCHSEGRAFATQSMSWRQRRLPTVFPSGSAIPFLVGQPAQISVKQGILVILSTGGD